MTAADHDRLDAVKEVISEHDRYIGDVLAHVSELDPDSPETSPALNAYLVMFNSETVGFRDRLREYGVEMSEPPLPGHLRGDVDTFRSLAEGWRERVATLAAEVEAGDTSPGERIAHPEEDPPEVNGDAAGG